MSTYRSASSFCGWLAKHSDTSGHGKPQGSRSALTKEESFSQGRLLMISDTLPSFLHHKPCTLHEAAHIVLEEVRMGCDVVKNMRMPDPRLPEMRPVSGTQ